MKKNILIISYGYPPINDAGAQRPYAIAKYLDKDKFNVTVLTCLNPSASLGVNENFDPALENVNVIRIKSYIGGNTSNSFSTKVDKKGLKSKIKSFIFVLVQKMMFPDKGMFWYPNVKKYLKNNKDLIDNCDFVFSTSPGLTNHRIARLVKRKNSKIKWLADFRDFNYVDGWENINSFKSFLHKRLENSIITESTFLTFVTKTMQKSYQNFYPKYRNKMFNVFNGFDKSDFSSSLKKNEHKKIVIFYAGSFYGGIRTPIPLLQLVDRILNENVLSKNDILIQIAGIVENEMKEKMENYKSFECVSLLGNLPRTTVIEYMFSSTFLCLIVGNIKTHYQTIPIKFFEYIASRRPIINFAPDISECSNII